MTLESRDRYRVVEAIRLLGEARLAGDRREDVDAWQAVLEAIDRLEGLLLPPTVGDVYENVPVRPKWPSAADTLSHSTSPWKLIAVEWRRYAFHLETAVNSEPPTVGDDVDEPATEEPEEEVE